MKHNLLRCIMLLIFIGIAPRAANAVDFQADYDVQYAVSPLGNTIVTQNITLTNNVSNIYPKQFAITIDAISIKNVIAYDTKGVITPQIAQADGKTTLLLTFNDQVVGLGKKLPFTLRYESSDIAQKVGTIWEIHIPGIENDPSIGSYLVSLQIPDSFGLLAYMTPLPKYKMKWTKDQLIHGGITAAYGDAQSFIVEITYPLENMTLTKNRYPITIPPDTAFQKVTISSIEPKPDTLQSDADGNWIAEYDLAPGTKIDVKVKLAVTTYIKKRPDYTSPSFDRTKLLSKQPFWETDNVLIQKIIPTVKTARDIYDYVVKTLSYDYGRIDQYPVRQGAVQALENPTKAVCTEFTDLFVALARANNIPARAIVGYAYTTNSKLRPASSGNDILHAWPEYYDDQQQIWIPVDPTWANTTKGVDYFDTLDFNHIVFAIHGTSSETPYPAGSFKQGSIPKKNVSVRFDDKKQQIQQGKLAITFDFPKTATAGKIYEGYVIVENTSSSAIDKATIIVQTDPFPITITKNEQNIPPLSKISVPVKVPITNYLVRGSGKIIASVNGEVTTFTYTVTPMYWLLLPIFSILLGILLLIWTIFRKR